MDYIAEGNKKISADIYVFKFFGHFVVLRHTKDSTDFELHMPEPLHLL